MNRYLRTVYRENNHHSFPDGYARNYELNTALIYSFYWQITHFFESSATNFKHSLDLLDHLHWTGHSYLYGVRTQDKPEELRRVTGKFIYKILKSFIAFNKINEENDYTVYMNLHELYDNFLEVSDGLEGNVAYIEFIGRLKNKIIGTPLENNQRGEWSFNYAGYFPEMILVYFYMFGFYLFASGNRSGSQDTDLHIPIMSKLADAFPKLYDGFKQEFYEAGNLPEGKESELKKQGRKIVSQFLRKNIIYNREENSLTQHAHMGVHGLKIDLNKVKQENVISVEEI